LRNKIPMLISPALLFINQPTPPVGLRVIIIAETAISEHLGASDPHMWMEAVVPWLVRYIGSSACLGQERRCTDNIRSGTCPRPSGELQTAQVSQVRSPNLSLSPIVSCDESVALAQSECRHKRGMLGDRN
jgi:hypothetical protein